MREFEVLFTTKASGPAGQPEKVVTEIGAQHWKLRKEAAIEWLKVDNHTFYVKAGEEKLYLVPASRNGQTWLRTSGNWDESNLLLNLPEFPPDFGKG